MAVGSSSGRGMRSDRNRKAKQEAASLESARTAVVETVQTTQHIVNNNQNINSNARRMTSGVFTCQTCNALFTCLQYYQQHRKHHAKCNGISLLCCNHCPYSTENQFHFNWHIMSHTGEDAHVCSVCSQPTEEATFEVPSSSATAVKVEDGDETEEDEDNDDPLMTSKRSVGCATNDDLLLLESTPSRRESSEECLEDLQSNYFTTGFSPNTQFHDSVNLFGEDAATADGMEEHELVTTDMNGMEMHRQHDITDEEDDEEEEIESEEDSSQQQYPLSDVANQHNKQHHDPIQQGPPYTKSPDADSGSADPVVQTGRGRGKGNRKSRVIDQPEGGGEFRRKFHCSHCGKSFKTKSHLQRHILTHTGEKPYHCNRCGSKFNQSSSLRNHIIAIHTKEYPHYCQHCNKGFLMPALLSKHLTTSHRDKPSSSAALMASDDIEVPFFDDQDPSLKEETET